MCVAHVRHPPLLNHTQSKKSLYRQLPEINHICKYRSPCLCFYHFPCQSSKGLCDFVCICWCVLPSGRHTLFPTIIVPTTHHCFHIEAMSSPQSSSRLIAYHHGSIIFCQMLACDWLISLRPLSLKPLIVFLPYWKCEFI